jgi:hypothetical protein
MFRGLGSTATPPFPSPPRWQSVVSHAALACGGEGQLIGSRTSVALAGPKAAVRAVLQYPLCPAKKMWDTIRQNGRGAKRQGCVTIHSPILNKVGCSLVVSPCEPGRKAHPGRSAGQHQP